MTKLGSRQDKTLFFQEFIKKHLNLRQLHAHKHSRHEEAQEDADKPDKEQQEAVKFWNVRSIGAVQDYKAKPPHGEKEAGG